MKNNISYIFLLIAILLISACGNSSNDDVIEIIQDLSLEDFIEKEIDYLSDDLDKIMPNWEDNYDNDFEKLKDSIGKNEIKISTSLLKALQINESIENYKFEVIKDFEIDGHRCKIVALAISHKERGPIIITFLVMIKGFFELGSTDFYATSETRFNNKTDPSGYPGLLHVYNLDYESQRYLGRTAYPILAINHL
jgi:hypothetical protein